MALGSHHAHPAPPSKEQPELTLRFASRSLLGVALWTAILDPGEDVLIVDGAAPWLAPLAELVGGHPSTVDAHGLWNEIGARTRAVVLRADGELQQLLSETDVLPIVVLQPGAALSDARAIGIEGSMLTIGGLVGAALRSTLVHHAELVRAAERVDGLG